VVLHKGQVAATPAPELTAARPRPTRFVAVIVTVTAPPDGLTVKVVDLPPELVVCVHVCVPCCTVAV
jgi:hypothetical protein